MQKAKNIQNVHLLTRVTASSAVGEMSTVSARYLHQAWEAAGGEHVRSRGRFTPTAMRLSEVIQGIAVGAEDNGVDDAGRQSWKRHALEESVELITGS